MKPQLPKKQTRNSQGSLNINLILFPFSLLLWELQQLGNTGSSVKTGIWITARTSSKKTWKHRVHWSLWLLHVPELRRGRDYGQGPAGRRFWSPRPRCAWQSCQTKVSAVWDLPPSAQKCQTLAPAGDLASLEWEHSSSKYHQWPSPQLTAWLCGILTLFLKLLWAAAAYKPRIISALQDSKERKGKELGRESYGFIIPC